MEISTRSATYTRNNFAYNDVWSMDKIWKCGRSGTRDRSVVRYHAGIPRIMQIQLATFPILMYLACRAKLEGILDSFEHISTVSVTSDLSRSSRFRFRSNFCNSKANDLEYLYADVRSSDEIDEKNQRGIGISVPIRRLEAVKYSKRSFENLKSKSKKPIEL